MFDENTLVCLEGSPRLDAYLSSETGLSRSRIVTIIESGNVFVNGSPKNKNYKLSPGDQVKFELPPNEEIDALPEDIDLDIYYEDEHIVVINKPQGMCVHPAPGNYNGTLVNALLHHCGDSLSGINGKLRPGIVHRIDKDTSGLIIVAKNDETHTKLGEMFQTHNFTRKYQAVVYGGPKDDEGTIRLAIGRSKKDRKKMAFYPIDTPNTKNAVTHYKVLNRFRGYSHLELTLETGRTHQIRVHLLSMNCPIVGDPVYAPGRECFGLEGQFLHAFHIAFKHPITGEDLSFSSPLPQKFSEVISVIEKRS